ncbi:abortive infection protein [Leptolyngbya sp. 'hensonii']|uniref:abortive infection protein n=1 Tax=Leptolyngbya sp. 'hensonii' TaxID=1922337 RepID=UPI000950278C|nr:abortive infection protein [Leptolyngbya sp. 'hensonii']OLP17100.1 abortive infection protein [Leptolyngbya sp. 'hensonii']
MSTAPIWDHCFDSLQASLVLLSLAVLGLFWWRQRQPVPPQPSNYDRYRPDPFNHWDTYPVAGIVPPLDHPVAPWMGRLILPTPDQRTPGDSVLFEIHHQPSQAPPLAGAIVRLQWSQEPAVQAYVQAATQSIQFTQTTIASQRAGRLHPDRLNHWHRVGPLESLAGARPDDNVMVLLREPVLVREPDEEAVENRLTVQIAQEPVQITGCFYTLFTVLERCDPEDDRFTVRHFNQQSGQFDGTAEVIRIPQVVADRDGIFRSTNQGLEQSPLNRAGWYGYGARDIHGTFVVQALEPRALTRLEPDEIILGVEAGLQYIHQQNWADTGGRKGTWRSTLLDPLAQDVPAALASWQAGDRALVIHLYGGMRGEQKDERGWLGLVTGHFAYGQATVVRDPLSDELRFEIEYQQIYAHNADGIIAGAMTWANYMGDLQRGWLGDRPVSDLIIQWDVITQDYEFDGLKLSPLGELLRELNYEMALCRTGGGTGATIVTPARSCVQNSNQALYRALHNMEQIVQAHPEITFWLYHHPDHPQTARFHQLVALGRSLERQLLPLGFVRRDWQNKTDELASLTQPEPRLQTLLRALETWRTMLPRLAHDEMASLLLKQGAKLWVIRTNQIGGLNPDILPLAPTTLLGDRSRQSNQPL